MCARALRTLGICVILALSSTPVAAHESPRVREILERAGSAMVLVSNRGLIFGDRESGAYRLLCKEALQINTSEQASAALLPDGALIVSTSAGLVRTRDEGCTFEHVAPFVDINTAALAQDPVDAAKIYVASFGSGQGGIHVSADSAQSFIRARAASDEEFYEDLLIAPGNAQVLYASGLAFNLDGGPRTHFIERSRDGATSFERFAIELGDNESDFTLLAVARSRTRASRAARSGSRGRPACFVRMTRRVRSSRSKGRSS